MKRPALATAGTVLGILLLIGGKALTSPDPLTFAGQSTSRAPSRAGAVTGPLINTRYGPLQVRVTSTVGN